ncbi:MAG: flagellar motor protein MotD [Gammaproteobacteria bacterium]|nr:flagellar motor protein MotD [Gammaproteobacteria bacterium]
MNRALRRRRERHEERAHHEAWAIPYADLMTLLLAFFVVMYAISSINTGKYRVLADALSVAFKGGTESRDAGVMRPAGAAGLTVLDTSRGQDPISARGGRVEDASALDPGVGETREWPEVLNSGRIAARMARAAAPLVMRDQVVIRPHPKWVEVEIRNDVLFPSGSATLNPDAERVLAQLAGALLGFGNAIRVEGHTDNVPIQGGIYRDNWDLSAARAAAVVRVLHANGVDPARFAVLGFGEHRPVQSNDTESGRRANRRVLFAILGEDDVAEGPYGRQRGSRGTGDAHP